MDRPKKYLWENESKPFFAGQSYMRKPKEKNPRKIQKKTMKRKKEAFKLKSLMLNTTQHYTAQPNQEKTKMKYTNSNLV